MEDSLDASIRFRELASSVDPRTQELTVRIFDDDEIFAVTLPAGSLTEVRPGVLRFRDPAGTQYNGLRSLFFVTDRNGVRIALEAEGADLSSADMSDHFVTVEVSIGDFSASHTRLWQSQGQRLRI
jgi:hypothetical protein